MSVKIVVKSAVDNFRVNKVAVIAEAIELCRRWPSSTRSSSPALILELNLRLNLTYLRAT
jgi:hypothetical protein